MEFSIDNNINDGAGVIKVIGGRRGGWRQRSQKPYDRRKCHKAVVEFIAANPHDVQVIKKIQKAKETVIQVGPKYTVVWRWFSTRSGQKASRRK